PICSRPMRFLGETSYSFYLSHAIFLYGISFYLLDLTNSFVVTWLVVLVVSYFVSYIFFNFIEMPMNRVGHGAVRWTLAQQPFRMFFPNGIGLNTPASEVR